MVLSFLTILLRQIVGSVNVDRHLHYLVPVHGSSNWTKTGTKLAYNGIVNIHGGLPHAVLANYMQNGSLTIGDTLLNYGGGNTWTANTAGLMFECLNNTEIAVHDAGKRVSSLIYYEGDLVNRITLVVIWDGMQ